MLDHLRQKIITTIESVSIVTVSTYGPAGIQAGNFPCDAEGLRLYLLVPRTSEILFNLEDHPKVIVTSLEWHLHGLATCVPAGNVTEPAIQRLSALPDAAWGEIVEIRPTRLQLHPTNPALPRETIDIPETDRE